MKVCFSKLELKFIQIETITVNIQTLRQKKKAHREHKLSVFVATTKPRGPEATRFHQPLKYWSRYTNQKVI